MEIDWNMNKNRIIILLLSVGWFISVAYIIFTYNTPHCNSGTCIMINLMITMIAGLIPSMTGISYLLSTRGETTSTVQQEGNV